MSAEQNRETIREAYRLFFAGDLDTMVTLLSPEIEVLQAAGLPYGGTYKGIDGFKEQVARILAFWEALSFDVSQLLASEDLVVAYGEWRGTVKVTGKTVRFPMTEVWHLDQGKVVRILPIYSDTAAVRDAAA